MTRTELSSAGPTSGLTSGPADGVLDAPDPWVAAWCPPPAPARHGRSAPCTVLFLTAETGGGHQAATRAIGQALNRCVSGAIATVTCDPLTGPDAHGLLRRAGRWYGPITRAAPWLWAVVFHLTNRRWTMALVRRLLARFATAPIAAALARHRPAVVVSTHSLLVDAAVRAGAEVDGDHGARPALVTVVTDLATAHASWWHPRVDRTVAPTAELVRAGHRAGAAHVDGRPTGIPVGEAFRRRPLSPADRRALRRTLGLRPGRFVVLVTAGGEGARGLRAWTRALLRHVPEVDVAVVCGRNASARADLDALTARAGGRLRVAGLVDDMADWLRCADLVVTKAGPSIIAEATAVGVPMLLPSHVPGQERGNADVVVDAGAARRVRGTRQLVGEVRALCGDPEAMTGLRAAARRQGRPDAAARLAALIADDARARAASSPGGGSLHETERRSDEPT